MAAPVELSIVHEQAAKSRSSARDILRTADYLDIDTKVFGAKGREGNNGSVGYQRNAFAVGNAGQGPYVGHKELRIGNDFKEQCSGVLVNERFHLLQIGKVGKACFDT